MKVICCALVILAALKIRGDTKVGSVSFLIAVNDSWKYDPPLYNDTCMVTVKTGPLYPDVPLNKSESIQIGDCDGGPLVYTINGQGEKSSIFLTFYSSVTLDASPPTCTIDWNYEYRIPTQFVGETTSYRVAQESLLPGCATADSREGYHMTYYWFYIIDWTMMTFDPSVIIPKHPVKPLAVASISFLVAVNVTELGCMATSRTPPLQPGVKHNSSEKIHVGKCDEGPLDFRIFQEKNNEGEMHTYVEVEYYSSALLAGGPASCKIQWDYAYRVPGDSNPERSLLPGCYTTDSNKESYSTYYWIYVIDWSYG